MDGFKSIEELYQRIKPALKSKVKDLNRIGINYVQEVDIFNYLKNEVWCKKTNLTLGEIVNDVMTLETPKIEEYVQKLFSSQKREILDDEVL